jgi:O-antigen/teichoic acid export membrane protein
MSKKKPKVAPAGQAPPSPPAFKGLARDTLVLFILLNLFNLVNFLYHFIIARILTPADYGILATLIAIVFIFAVSSEAIQN